MGSDFMISVKEQKEGIIQLALNIIREFVTDYYEIGVFGSVARGTYSASSDVDIYLITNTIIDKHIRAELSAELDELNVDIVFLIKNDFLMNQDHLLIKNIMKDRRILDRGAR
jgi:predicted nucleotidyltransferase